MFIGKILFRISMFMGKILCSEFPWLWERFYALNFHVYGKDFMFFMFYVLLTVHLDHFCNENQLDALSLFYFVRQPLHVSGVFIVLYCIYVHSDWCVIHLADCQVAGSGWNRSNLTVNTS
jgi:hypothetical protein